AAGTVFLMWLGELITEKGIGNGVSLLIFAGIIADFPNNIRQMLITWDPANLPAYLLFFGMALLIIAGVVLINEGNRNIPVSYAKRVRGTKMYGGVSTYLPLKINPAGVIPIICFITSKTTETTINKAVPPIKKVKTITPVIPPTIEGMTAIDPKNKAPINNTLFKI
ncbi:unnamed protein product, partial [marine sediment metagenome]